MYLPYLVRSSLHSFLPSTFAILLDSFYGKAEAILFVAGVRLSPDVAQCLYTINALRRHQYQVELIAEAAKAVGESMFQSFYLLQHGFQVNGVTYWSQGVEVGKFKKTSSSKHGMTAVS